MGTISLDANPADSLTFDNIVEERRAQTVTVTRHPVESGGVIADHTQREPDLRGVVGRITDTPQGRSGSGAITLARAFFERVSGQPVTYTSLRSGATSSLVITSWSDSFSGLQEAVFTVSFQQVVLAFAVSVPIPPTQPVPAAQASTPSSQDAGLQPPQPETPTATLRSTMATFF